MLLNGLLRIAWCGLLIALIIKQPALMALMVTADRLLARDQIGHSFRNTLNDIRGLPTNKINRRKEET